MLSIDEAIEQFKYDAECNRADLDLSYAEDNEQVAAWLEELKAYREIGTVEGCKSAIECYTEEYLLRRNLQDQIQEQYNKEDKPIASVCYGREDKKIKKVKCICNDPVCGMKIHGENSPLLKIGEVYTVTDVEIHGWYTLYKLQEFGDKQFNSVDFTPIS